MPEELAFWARSGAYGLGIAAVYWFVSYDGQGTTLLGAFGIATGAAFLLLRQRVGSAARRRDSDVPLADESGAVPLRSGAPILLGVGISLLGLALVYGIWFAIAAVVPVAFGAIDWLASVRREHDLVVSHETSMASAGAPGDATGGRAGSP
jgi:hypothetical protein